MKKLKLSIYISTILSLTIPQTTRAEPNCSIEQEQQIKDCEALLKQADEVIESKKQIISKQDEALAKQLQILNAQEDYVHAVERERDAWYRNPYVVVPLSLLVGGFIVYQVRK